MAQAISDDGLLRGAQAMADYLNSLMIGGKPVSRAAVYRMIEARKIPVKRLGGKSAEIWARKGDLDNVLGLGESAKDAA